MGNLYGVTLYELLCRHFVTANISEFIVSLCAANSNTVVLTKRPLRCSTQQVSRYSSALHSMVNAVTTLAGAAAASDMAQNALGRPIALSVNRINNDVVVICDQRIRKITPQGVVSTLAGTAGTLGYRDGEGSNALFSEPNGVAVDRAGNVIVADSCNNCIRKITPQGV
eukprot:5742410-Pyramimonas_sp.AAC.2